ncbi:MAG: hypothetical protein O7G28_10610 [Deltaproteobacteria bacterium]|nr:hypothetical protein [Deltaproteobacteria bacterium]
MLATVGMSIPMIVGTATGTAPMPEPIPKAVVTSVVGKGLPIPLIMVLAAGSHLAYGGIWAALLTQVTDRVTIWKGLALGLFLWLVMQVAFLPFIGWGLFGMGITPKIAVATLVLHMIYGGLVGWLVDRRTAT